MRQDWTFVRSRPWTRVLSPRINFKGELLQEKRTQYLGFKTPLSVAVFSCKKHKVNQLKRTFPLIPNLVAFCFLFRINENAVLIDFCKHRFAPLWWREWQWLSSDWLVPHRLGFCVTDAPASASAFLPASRPLIPPNGGCHLAANLNAQTTKLPHLAKLIPARRAPFPHS